MTGHNTIKMTELSVLYKKLGFRENKTYIQSGNVIFRTEDNADPLHVANVVEEGILKKFGYTIPVMIRTTEELRKLRSANPYLSEPGFDPSRMAVIFLHGEVTEKQIEKMKNINYPPDKYQISDREIFTYCPDGFGKTKLYTNFFEKKMGVTGTARNWKTVVTLLEMAEEF